MTSYPYFPGCSLYGTAREYDLSTRAVLSAVDIELQELDGWLCCGATPAHSTSHLLATSLAAANLAIAARTSERLVTACAACYSRLLHAEHDIKSDPQWAEKVRSAGVDYSGGVEVLHVMDVLLNDVGIDAIQARSQERLAGLKVACYYGCLLSRPAKLIPQENAEHPHRMDDILRACGADTVEWAYSTECCGAGLAMAHPEVITSLCHKILAHARKAGADVVAVGCPLCQTNLELRQPDIHKAYGVKHDMPVLYFTQLMGLALGIDPSRLGIDRLLIDPTRKLKQLTASRT
ncbi:MAG: CoB--CoM heterodisulfide reductase iron-sulfur subunit B family protein [Armatimonadota bacterium]